MLILNPDSAGQPINVAFDTIPPGQTFKATIRGLRGLWFKPQNTGDPNNRIVVLLADLSDKERSGPGGVLFYGITAVETILHYEKVDVHLTITTEVK